MTETDTDSEEKQGAAENATQEEEREKNALLNLVDIIYEADELI